ncbi:hypothetical protein [Corynebacterium sp. 335C]
MDAVFDAVGQWLTQQPVVVQTILLLAVLLPVGGAAAFGLIGVIDVAVGRLHGRWARRPAFRRRVRIEPAGPAARGD